MESTTTVTPIWTTVLRAFTCELEEYGMASYGTIVHNQAVWTMESAADESGLKLTQVYFGDDLKDFQGNPVTWNYDWSYEIQRNADGLWESIWWPVLHRKHVDRAALMDKINASITIYEVIDDPDDDMESFLSNQVELAQSMLKSNNLSESQREHWMGYKDAIQKVRLFTAEQPAPALPKPVYNVLVLLDKHGTVEAGTDGLVNVFILDETIKDHPNEPTKQESEFFNMVWDRLPVHYAVEDNGSIYDFSEVGL